MPHASVATHEHGSAAALRFSCAESGTEDASLVAVAGELDIATVPCLDQALRRAEADAALVVLEPPRVGVHRLERRAPFCSRPTAASAGRAGGSSLCAVVTRSSGSLRIGIDAELEFVDWPSAARAAPAVRERVPA
jgi:hypothetical protein